VGELPPLSPAAVRVAEGAAEFVPVCDLAEPAADLRRLKEVGYAVVVTSSHRGEPIFAAKLPGKVVPIKVDVTDRASLEAVRKLASDYPEVSTRLALAEADRHLSRLKGVPRHAAPAR
jgi:hypothetical protein